MARKRTISISALNIAMHQPHSPKKYLAFMKKAFSLREKVKLSNVHYAMIGSSYTNPENENEINGDIFRFVKIDPNEPWFNEKTQEPATKEEQEEVSLPNHLLPNLQRIPYIFLADKHCLFIITKDRKTTISPATIQNIIERIISKNIIQNEFPEVAVTVISDAEQVNKLLKLPDIRKITIKINRPNADDADDIEQNFMERLERIGASSKEEIYTAEKGNGIFPDEDITNIANAATKNGKVTVVSRDSTGGTRILSTDEFPKKVNATVNSEIETTLSVLRREAHRWLLNERNNV